MSSSANKSKIQKYKKDVMKDERPVKEIYATAILMSGQEIENHWAWILKVDDDVAIRMDIVQVKKTSRKGDIDWFETPYAMTRSTVKEVQFTRRKNFTVKDVADLVYHHHREQFDFNPGGSGCRAWMYAVAQDLAHEGFIVSNEPSLKLSGALRHSYTKENPKGTPIEWIEGSFTHRHLIKNRMAKPGVTEWLHWYVAKLPHVLIFVFCQLILLFDTANLLWGFVEDHCTDTYRPQPQGEGHSIDWHIFSRVKTTGDKQWIKNDGRGFQPIDDQPPLRPPPGQ